MKLYLYKVDRTRAYAMSEQGTFYQIDTNTRNGYYSDQYYEQANTLLCSFNAHEFEETNNLIRLTPDGEYYSGEQFDSSHAFTVEEVAAFLGLSKQRIVALIDNKQLAAKKRGHGWFVKGDVLVEFAAKERPAHRPKKVESAQ